MRAILKYPNEYVRILVLGISFLWDNNFRESQLKSSFVNDLR